MNTRKIVRACLLALLAMCMPGLRAQEGSIDPAFNTADQGFGKGDGADHFVYALAVQSDGKAIIGGIFYAYNAQPCRGLVRVGTDGLRDASFDAGQGAPGTVHGLVLQADGKVIVTGQFNSFDQTVCGNVVRLNTNGSVDASFLSGVGADLSAKCAAVQSNGKVIIGGAFTTYDGVSRNRVARLNSDGTLDATFNVGTGFDGEFDQVYAVAVQPDGKIVVAGSFDAYNGTACHNIVRLNSNGTVDPFFSAGSGPNDRVYSMALQTDGRVLIAGTFSTINSISRSGIGRLTTTGAVDPTFDPGLGTNDLVTCVKVQTDGNVLLCGEFTAVNSTPRSRIARLLSNGAVDATFDPGTGADDEVTCLGVRPDGKVLLGGIFRYFNGKGCGRMALLESTGSMDLTHNPVHGANGPADAMVRQADGRIIIGGDFTGVNGQGRKRIARLMADGTLDASFNPGTGSNWPIASLAIQPDGKIIAAGGPEVYNGTPVKRIVRLNTDGTLDPSFYVAQGVNNGITQCVLQPDGKILISGYFTTFNGISRNRIARLNTDGTLDTGFAPGTGADGWINEMIVLSDGRIMIAGVFTSYNGQPRKNVARLHADGGLDPTFDPGSGPGSGSTWIRNMVRQPDGRLVIVGSFSTYGGVSRPNIARIMADGALDPTFNPGTGVSTYTIYALALAPDGKVLIGGSFPQYNGTARQGLARVHTNGSLDLSFDPGSGAGSWISRIVLLEDGDLVVSGNFNAYDGTGRNRIARINGTARVGTKVILEGPYSGTSMNDALRTLPSFPLTEPFTAMGYAETGYVSGATIGSSVLTTTGNNAIVDWVIVEMRPVATPGTVAAARAVLLQRDGDVVDLDGVSTVGFAGLAPGNYCVAVKPRNHLPVMLSTTTPVSYGSSGIATVDFTLPTTQVYDNDSRKNVSGVMVIAAGDGTFNETVRYTGGGNDRDPILIRVGSTTPNNTVSGYWREDLNMDGVVKYTGSANDRDIILTNVGSTTPNNTRVATLP